MTWAVTASTVASIGGALLGGHSARKQARIKAKALKASAADIAAAYEKAARYNQPYITAGEEGLNALRGMINYKQFGAEDFQTDPGYQFRLQEGLKQLGRTAAARGGALSGATLRGTQDYSQKFASNEYSNAFNRYLQQRQEALRVPTYLAGVGQQAAGSLSDLGTNYGTNMANLSMGQGAVDAAQTAAKYDMYGNILNAGANALGGYLGSRTPSTLNQGGMGGNFLGNIDTSNVPRRNLPIVRMPGS